MRLGEYLKNQGLVNDEQIRVALAEQAQTGEKIGEIMVRFGFITRKALEGALATINPQALIGQHSSYNAELPLELLRKHQAVIVGDTGHIIYISTLSPRAKEVLASIQEEVGQRRVVMLAPSDHGTLLDKVKKLETAEETQKDVPSATSEEATPIAEIIKGIIVCALDSRASDIHIETSEKTVHVRNRIDGILYIHRHMPFAMANKLFTRIKDMAGMDVSEKRVPQDGSFSMEYQGRSVDFRVATLPSAYGEKITIRILDKERVMINIRDLGITAIEEWLTISNLTNGLILVCGATGSGKTTTLYSTVRYLDTFRKSVYMIEDPIEYRIPFVNQIQVQRRVDFSFAEFTRAVLRHDPDIVIVGEVRDRETAENATRLAETGHLVYATLHTNDIPSTLSRLFDLGMSKTDLSFSLRGILVQKLCRKLCHCKGAGCAACHGIGYVGRTLLTEFARVNGPEDIDSIRSGKFRYITFCEDALMKYESGVTDAKELNRVLGSEIIIESASAAKE